MGLLIVVAILLAIFASIAVAVPVIRKLNRGDVLVLETGPKPIEATAKPTDPCVVHEKTVKLELELYGQIRSLESKTHILTCPSPVHHVAQHFGTQAHKHNWSSNKRTGSFWRSD